MKKTIFEKNYQCPICSSTNIVKYVNARSHKNKYSFNVQTWKCEDCDFYFQNPIIDYEKVKSIYHDGYVGGRESQEKRFNYEIESRKSSALSFLDLLKDGDSVAEVGCSSGYNLQNIRENFNGDLSLVGFDFDKNSVEYGANRTGIHLSTEDIFSTSEKYNFILLNHVFEHVLNPVEFFENLLKIVEDDGYLIINVPDAKRFLEVPSWEHVSYFSEKSMNVLASKFGKNFVISSNIIHKEKNNGPEIRLIFSKNGAIPKRKSDEYIPETHQIRGLYDISNRSNRNELANFYKKYIKNPRFWDRLIWSKFFIAFTFKWIKK